MPEMCVSVGRCVLAGVQEREGEGRRANGWRGRTGTARGTLGVDTGVDVDARDEDEWG